MTTQEGIAFIQLLTVRLASLADMTLQRLMESLCDLMRKAVEDPTGTMSETYALFAAWIIFPPITAGEGCLTQRTLHNRDLLLRNNCEKAGACKQGTWSDPQSPLELGKK